jgi:DNA-binding response OmpR family regulator
MPKKILVIDDERQMVDMLKMRLEANNYEVLAAYDGRAGLEKAKSEKPDLIILDLMLPGMDGYKVSGLLKADTRYSGIPVIMFTARARESDREMGKTAGADAYITKPFEPQALLGKIRELLKEN